MLLIAEPYRPTFTALGLNSFDSIASSFGPGQPAQKSGVFVEQRMLHTPGRPPIPIFYKQYFHHPPSLGFLGRASKARCEYASYEAFTALEIRCAGRVACGEQRDWLGRLRSAFIITRAIPEAMGLIEFLSKRCPLRSGPASATSRRAALRQLAAMTRVIHGANFYHHDLVWRNILVTMDANGGPLVWWIDCPRGQFDRWSPWRHRRVLKDLASLDKSASKFCSRTERIDFIRAYLGKTKLDGEAWTLIRDAIRYRRQRWPEDWNEG